MTTLREAAQMAMDALEEIPYMSNKDDYENVSRVITTLRAALAAPPQELDLPKVQLWEFLKLIEGKEDFRGIPLMRTEWPTQGEALAQPEQEPKAFYVYKPTLPRGSLGNVADGDLPWVYDQDPSSGYSAKMLVYPASSAQGENNETDNC